MYLRQGSISAECQHPAHKKIRRPLQASSVLENSYKKLKSESSSNQFRPIQFKSNQIRRPPQSVERVGLQLQNIKSESKSNQFRTIKFKSLQINSIQITSIPFNSKSSVKSDVIGPSILNTRARGGTNKENQNFMCSGDFR